MLFLIGVPVCLVGVVLTIGGGPYGSAGPWVSGGLALMTAGFLLTAVGARSLRGRHRAAEAARATAPTPAGASSGVDDATGSAGAGGFLEVSRSGASGRDGLRRYGLVVDGVDVAGLGIGERTVVPVTAGAHTLRAVIDWTGSEELVVTVAPGQRVGVLIEPAGGLNPFTAYSLDKYLRITQTS